MAVLVAVAVVVVLAVGPAFPSALAVLQRASWAVVSAGLTQAARASSSSKATRWLRALSRPLDWCD